MNHFKPEWDQEDLNRETPDFEPTPEGTYIMRVRTQPELGLDKNGLRYLNVFLGHTGTNAAKYQGVGALLHLEGTYEFTDKQTGKTRTANKNALLVSFLKAIGLSADNISEFSVAAENEVSEGCRVPATLAIAGDPIDVMAEGVEVKAKVTISKSGDNEYRNVRRFYPVK